MKRADQQDVLDRIEGHLQQATKLINSLTSAKLREYSNKSKSVIKEPDAQYLAVKRDTIKTIAWRGKIWEGCRPEYEKGRYADPIIDRLLREGIIVPAKDPDGGYVLPT